MVSGDEIVWMSALELAKAIKKGELSPVEVVDAFLDRIDKLNPELNAFVTLTEESARKEAKKAEQAVKKGEKLGPLHGVPVAIKDNTHVKGVRLTYGSKLFENYVAEEDNILVARLRSAGAIIMGMTNMSEFGLVGITDNPLFGVTRNPWDTSRSPAGSSGGSAVAVAAGMCPIATGGDAGGSIRVPASLCGIFGLKPHLGRIPVWPGSLGPKFETTGVKGPITRTVADSALMMDIMSGPDERDSHSLPAPGVSYFEKLEEDVKGKRFAYSPDLGHAVIEPEIMEVTRKAAMAFGDLGYDVEEVELDLPNLSNEMVVTVVADAFTWAEDRWEEWKKVAYPPYLEFMWLKDHLKATDYMRAQYRRGELYDKVREVFEKYDFLLTPTSPVPAFSLEIGTGPSEIAGKPAGPTGVIAFTFPFNLSGHPAASVPCGFTKENLPVGLQIVGNRFDELGILQASRTFEKAFPWKDKRPPI